MNEPRELDHPTLNETTLIKVDGGDMFEGNLYHWRDNGFSDDNLFAILDFCKFHGCHTVEIRQTDGSDSETYVYDLTKE